MKDKCIKITDNPKSSKVDIYEFLKQKIQLFQNIIQKTIIAIQKYKLKDILGTNEINICINKLKDIFEQLSELYYPIIKKTKLDTDQIINKLQEINNEISIIFKTYGTESIDDLIMVCFGNDFINCLVDEDTSLKFDIIRKYVHPIGYKVLLWTNNNSPVLSTTILEKNKIVEDYLIVESSINFDCFDLARTSKNFLTRVHGIKIVILNTVLKKTLIISGIVDELMLECINSTYIDNKLQTLQQNIPNEPDFKNEGFARFIKSLTIKELLIYNIDDLYKIYIGHISQMNLIKHKTISQTVKDFVNNTLYNQRLTLIQLLLKDNDNEFQYLAYLLYDLLSTDTNGHIDTQEQTILYDSLPWYIKYNFRDAMKQTIQYTNTLSNFDINNIPLEQQICLLKANDNVKEKAMTKLKEVKAKSEDSGAKARQYLEGLLKIPFGIYREEPIIIIIDKLKDDFSKFITNITEICPYGTIIKKFEYTNIEIIGYINIIENEYIEYVRIILINNLIKKITNTTRSGLIKNINYLNKLIKIHILQYSKICHSGKKIDIIKEQVIDFINNISKNVKYSNIIKELILEFIPQYIVEGLNIIDYINKTIKTINNALCEMSRLLNDVTETLDNAVHGHIHAKRQIERIIGQWANGRVQSGHCFGFEGPPGVGKTSFAKNGLAACLKNIDGESRPFAFVPVGGGSNGSTIEGHNYTYVGSSYGRVVDIIIESKCLNPIIFIDELDKVSKTEHGREIIGILTHLCDETQNHMFQDKYFNGIDLDLSKALIVFSYNDPSAIDKILLDRIHRVQFKHLSLDEKLVILEKYILPEIYEKMGLNDIIQINTDVLEYIITDYTNEPGVRKLKELLFEIIGEINLNLLKATSDTMPSIPIIITKEDIRVIYLKEHYEISLKKIHTNPAIGVINGMWANAVGNGGILSIEACFIPASNCLDLKLTGMQGDVMKESMDVAKSVAFSLLPIRTKNSLITKLQKTKIQGIHIHCPDGATPKDGPSAGGAITTVIYSLMTGKKIDNTISMTGEINLQHEITKIGGLDLKILGSIKAGVKHILYPAENQDDFNKFMEKYNTNVLIEDITFSPVNNIKEVFKIIFV